MRSVPCEKNVSAPIVRSKICSNRPRPTSFMLMSNVEAPIADSCRGLGISPSRIQLPTAAAETATNNTHSSGSRCAMRTPNALGFKVQYRMLLRCSINSLRSVVKYRRSCAENSAFPRASAYETPYEAGGTIARDRVVSRNRPAGAVGTDNRARDPLSA